LTDQAHDLLPPYDWKRKLLLPLVVGALGAAVLIPFDWPVRDAIKSVPLGGDVKRELEMLQQFGGVSVLLLVIIIIALLDRARVRRVLDWLLAMGLGILLFNAMKIATGRHRPDVGLDTVWIGPLGRYDFTGAGHLARPIEFWKTGVFDNLSFPSTHTTHAAIAAVFLAALYPPLRWIVWPLVAITALMRVYVGAHWPSDVLVGACLGYALGHLIIDRYWGVRLLDWIWVKLVDRTATPAFPESVRVDRERSAA
jgi:membrane-associated phospholipid phosphatase